MTVCVNIVLRDTTVVVSVTTGKVDIEVVSRDGDRVTGKDIVGVATEDTEDSLWG